MSRPFISQKMLDEQLLPLLEFLAQRVEAGEGAALTLDDVALLLAYYADSATHRNTLREALLAMTAAVRNKELVPRQSPETEPMMRVAGVVPAAETYVPEVNTRTRDKGNN